MPANQSASFSAVLAISALVTVPHLQVVEQSLILRIIREFGFTSPLAKGLQKEIPADLLNTGIFRLGKLWRELLDGRVIFPNSSGNFAFDYALRLVGLGFQVDDLRWVGSIFHTKMYITGLVEDLRAMI